MNSIPERPVFCALLIDTDFKFRQAVADLLCMCFPLIRVEEASDGAEAVSKVDYLRPNIILTDVELPGKSGFELAKEVKQVYGNMVVVFLAANIPSEYAFGNGADCWISKADDSCIEQILSRIEEAMALSSRSL